MSLQRLTLKSIQARPVALKLARLVVAHCDARRLAVDFDRSLYGRRGDSALNQALARALAFRDAGKMPEAREWAAELVGWHPLTKFTDLVESDTMHCLSLAVCGSARGSSLAAIMVLPHFTWPVPLRGRPLCEDWSHRGGSAIHRAACRLLGALRCLAVFHHLEPLHRSRLRQRWRRGSGRKVRCPPIVLPHSNRAGPEKGALNPLS